MSAARRAPTDSADPTDYWNHNVAYHRWVLDRVRSSGARRVVDLGCGDGLLVQKLAAECDHVVGIEPDPHSADRARRRVARLDNATILQTDLAGHARSSAASAECVVVVAALHHLELRSALEQLSSLLAEGGTLLVVGLARPQSIVDWLVEAARVPVAWCGSEIHGETPEIGVPTVAPADSLREIRRAADEFLPGARIRRGIYFRYLLSWRKDDVEGAPPGS